MFADRIKQLLIENGKKQQDLALFIGVKQNTVSDWINKGTSPKIEHIYRIADFFDVSFNHLFAGESTTIPSFDSSKLIKFVSTSQKIDFKNKALHLKDDTLFTRFKEAREAAGISLSDAAAGAFLSEDLLLLLEDDDIPMLEIDARLKKVHEIGFDQLAYLAYRYNVDLYWLLCGKVRPPAAVIQDGHLVFPPYEFMMDNLSPLPEAHRHDSNLVKPDHEPRPISFAADGWADITTENEEKFVKKLQEFEKRAEEMKKGR